MPKLPLNLSKAVDAWKEMSAKARESASVVLAGDGRLVERAQSQFSVGGTVPATFVGPLADLPGSSSASGDVLLILVSAETEAEVFASLERAGMTGGTVIAVDEGERATAKVTYPSKHVARVSFSDSPAGWRRVFESCVELSGDRTVALGRRYPALRSAAARRVIERAAARNALIGFVFFLPGSDMPAMTLNQIKMVLSIASIYGEPIDLERAVELVAVVVMGFGFRAFARRLIRSTPGLRWVLRALAGYTATKAIGLGAVRYFEKGAPASTSRVVALAKSLKS